MPKLESAQKINKPESNPSERGVDINAGKQPEARLTVEEQLGDLAHEAEVKQQQVPPLTQSIEGTKAQLSEIRKKMGLPQPNEEPPSVLSDQQRLKELQTEQEALKKQQEELKGQQKEKGKEQLIQEEKGRILQEKLNELFKAFEKLNPTDLESILTGGKTREGRNVTTPSMGELDPQVAQSLAQAFKEGIRLLPRILEALPQLLKMFDEELTKEATERVEQNLEAAKTNPETGEGEAQPNEVTPEPAPVEGESTPNP
jgi:superfamily II RNA helicase